MIITRFHNLERIEATVEFLTPTFLGGADQQAELRSAPFKSLLRQWWRVLNGNLDYKQLLEREGELFGSVLDERRSSASSVRITIRPGDTFVVKDKLFSFGETFHPEAGATGKNVQNSLYLGFGPITSSKGIFTFRKYIAPGSRALLTVWCPPTRRDEVTRVLQLIDAFGTVGSRSRNGYGSISLSGRDFSKLDLSALPYKKLNEILGNRKSYPHGFARDGNGPLIWESSDKPSWDKCLKLLAETYLNARVSINIKGSSNELHERHALGYPITNHNVQEWGKDQGRMPSQLRLMVKKNRNNGLVARIVHLPHSLPKPWPNTLPPQETVWQQVHRFLDGQKTFHRIGGAP